MTQSCAYEREPWKANWPLDMELFEVPYSEALLSRSRSRKATSSAAIFSRSLVTKSRPSSSFAASSKGEARPCQ